MGEGHFVFVYPFLLFMYLYLYVFVFSHRLVGDHLDTSIREGHFVFVSSFLTLFVFVFVFVFCPPPRRRPLGCVHQGERLCIHPWSNGLQCAPCDRGSRLQCKRRVISSQLKCVLQCVLRFCCGNVFDLIPVKDIISLTCNNKIYPIAVLKQSQGLFKNDKTRLF